jgi:glutamine amidotransferase/cyclase
VTASSRDGKAEHFSEFFEKIKAEAALAAGIFHREEVPIWAVETVKEHMRERGIETRLIVTVSLYMKKGPSR